MSNSSDTRASFFGMFQSVTIQIKMNLAFGCRAAKKKGFYYENKKTDNLGHHAYGSMPDGLHEAR
jgi:hypothetical protein